MLSVVRTADNHDETDAADMSWYGNEETGFFLSVRVLARGKTRFLFLSGVPVTSWEGASDQYDYMGRRVVKTVSEWDGSEWTLNYEKLFVYDGWNLIEEITEQGTVQTSKYYVWGLDLSQSLQGAGGIGGLIASVSSSGVRYYLYDGNGNVGQVVEADGTIAARYEYDPFGNEIVAAGSEAGGNVFRFSTKYSDVETGLVYYGFRHYMPEFGRWITRDPSEETGGYNLYSFCYNESINWIDSLEMLQTAISRKKHQKPHQKLRLKEC